MARTAHEDHPALDAAVAAFLSGTDPVTPADEERARRVVDALVNAMREDLIGPGIDTPNRSPPRPAPPPKVVVVSWCTACGKSDYAYDHTQDSDDIKTAACPHCQTATMCGARYTLARRAGVEK